MRSLTPEQDDDDGGGGEDDDDEFGPNRAVCVTSSSFRPEEETDNLVRRLAMDAVWCAQLQIDPQNDLGVQTFDEKVRETDAMLHIHCGQITLVFVISERAVPDARPAVRLPLPVGCPVRHSGPNLWTDVLLPALCHPRALVSCYVGHLGGGNRPTEEGDSEAAGHVIDAD